MPSAKKVVLSFGLLLAASAEAPADGPAEGPREGVVRVATYNVSMYRDREGQLLEELAGGDSTQARRIAEVLQHVRPDVVLLNEFDYFDPPTQRGVKRLPSVFVERYLKPSQAAGLAPIDYPHRFYEPVNTGVDSGLDLDRDGKLHGPADAWGYGRYSGQYGMLLLSRFPLGTNWRTYQKMKWRHLASPHWPKTPRTGEHFYDSKQRDAMRLASKSFWDVEAQLPTDEPGRRWRPLRLLCAHPTPPAFDGPEDRNGCRNYDEIRMIAEYISGSRKSSFPVDANPYLSEGDGFSTLPPGADFVVLGDLNADPVDGGSRPGAIQQLLDHPAVNGSFVPTSRGAAEASRRRADLNADHRGDPAHDTADFSGDSHGNLRVDYVLPSKGLKVVGGGVYWPKEGEPGADATRASDHRLVWIDIQVE